MPYLQSPEAWHDIGVACSRVETIETHRAWVFLAGDRVLKFKKTGREAFLDFSSLARREWACREELRLNRRLAPEVYLGLVMLQRCGAAWRLVSEPARADPITPVDSPGGSPWTIEEWAVLMRRLPATCLLDRQLAAGQAVGADTLEGLATVLARFWAASPRADIDARRYVDGFATERARDAAVLLRGSLGLGASADPLLDRFERAWKRATPALRARVDGGHIRDGHGDLRPEHIALTDPPVVIDALEFNATLRAQDPYDELAFLGLECAMRGAPDIGPALVRRVSARLGEAPPTALLPLYAAHRALLRARLAMAHLLESPVRDATRWPARARAYLQRANQALAAFETCGTRETRAQVA